MIKILPQSNFPYLKEFAKKFAIDDKTIFAFDDIIYANDVLTNDLIIHERVHHEQQHRDGLEFWIKNYLNDDKYRLKMEKEAYSLQLKSIDDREKRNKLRIQSARTLSSPLYGSLITFNDALKLLK